MPHHFISLTRVFPVPSHILYSYPPSSSELTTPALLDLLCGSPGLKVLAFQGLKTSESEDFSLELRIAMGRTGSIVEKILGDAELLPYLRSSRGGLNNLVELDEINAHTFPDHWLGSRMVDYPDRL